MADPADTDISSDTPGAPVTNAPGAPSTADVPGAPGLTEHLVPGWLALLVLVLLLAVAALGGFALRGALTGENASTPREFAIIDWERQVDENPNDPDTMLGLGYAYQEQGRLDDALGMYEAVLELDPGNTGALYNKGVVLTELGRAEDAEVVFWDILEAAPDHALAAKALGEYYIDRQEYQSALVALEPVVEARPQFADLQYLAGHACEQLGLTTQAVEYYRGALTYAPDYIEAKEGLERLGETE